MDEEKKRLLMNTVQYGSFPKVKKLIYDGDFELNDSFFDYELLKAALRRKHVDISMFLLKIGCRVTNPSKTDSDDTPLHLAVAINSEYETDSNVARLGDRFGEVLLQDIIEMLLEKGASIYDKDSNGHTPLYAAYINGGERKFYEGVWITFNIIRFFNFDPANPDDVIHFHVACATNHLWMIARFLHCGFDPSKPIRLQSAKCDNLNPIQLSIKRNSFEIFKKYLPFTDLTIRNDKGMTYLHQIYFSGNSYPKSNRAWIRLAFKKAPKNYANFEDKHGLSHFHLCCMVNEPNIVKAYINFGEVDVNKAVSLDSTINPGYTPLHFAVESTLESVIEVLLKNGADPNKADKWGTTPLHLACKKTRNINIKILLLRYRASPVKVDFQQHTPLHLLVYNAKEDGILVFDSVMSRAQWGPNNLQDDAGLSLFHISCMTSDISRVRAYLESGVDINGQVRSGKYSGFTPLHFAVIYNQKEIVEFLLKNNAEVNVATSAGLHTALHLACEYVHYMNLDGEKQMHERRSNQLSIIELLLSHGADANARDRCGLTPLLRTCLTFKHSRRIFFETRTDQHEMQNETAITLTETIKALVTNEANIDARTGNQLSVLHLLSQCSFLRMQDELLDYLVLSGADINARDCAGFTPLHIAVQSVNMGMVKCLLNQKADLNAENARNKTPLHLAAKQIVLSDFNPVASVAILQDLLEYGADVNVNDTYIASLLDSENFEREDLSYGPLLKTIGIHVIKLSVLKLPASQQLWSTCHRLHRLYEHEYGEHFGSRALAENIHVQQMRGIVLSCRAELDEMKQVRLDCYTTLYDILLKRPHEMATHVKNSNLKTILDVDIHKYPLYGYLIRLQFNSGILRGHVLDSAKEVFKNRLSPGLTKMCFNIVLEYLEHDDIVKLKEAVLIGDENSKRKLGDNYDGQEEFPLKLKKRATARSENRDSYEPNGAFSYRHKKLRSKFYERSDNEDTERSNDEDI